MSKVYKDRPLEEFFGHGSMEMAERTGLALVEVAKTSKIFYGKTVVIATGANPRELGLENEAKLVGRGVHYCAH